MVEPTSNAHPLGPSPAARAVSGRTVGTIPLTTFLGREDELAAVLTQLRRPEVRLITLTGPGSDGRGEHEASRSLDDRDVVPGHAGGLLRYSQYQTSPYATVPETTVFGTPHLLDTGAGAL